MFVAVGCVVSEELGDVLSVWITAYVEFWHYFPLFSVPYNSSCHILGNLEFRICLLRKEAGLDSARL